MKKSMNKKIFGGTLIVAVLAILGAVLATANTDDTVDDENTCQDLEYGKPRGGHHPYFSELTEQQQEEINELRQQLTEEGATLSETRESINEKLAEFGVELPDRDDLLDEQIEQTTQMLEILELQRQLRDEGKSWEEIEDIIEDEYDITAFMNHHHGMMHLQGEHRMYDNSEDDSSIDDMEDAEEV